MQLQQYARDHNIPEDLSVLKILNESLVKFDKFQREYSDYKRFRERVSKRMPGTPPLLDARFTCNYVRRLLDDSDRLRIEQTVSHIDTEEAHQYFNRGMLIGDLKLYEQWREEAETVLVRLEDDDAAMLEAELRLQFERIREGMLSLPLHDKELYLRIEVFDWIY